MYILYIHLRIHLKKCGRLYYKLNKYLELGEITSTHTLFLNHNENIKMNKAATKTHKG